MAVLLPVRPFRNTARNITASTRDLICAELRAAADAAAASQSINVCKGGLIM